MEPIVALQVRGAGVTRPAVYTFTAQGDVKLGWTRMTPYPGPDLRQRLVFEHAAGALGRFQPVCETSWTPLGALPWSNQLLLAGGGRWRVRVFERNATPGVTPIPSDLAMISIVGALAGVVSADPPVLPFKDFSVSSEDRYVPCRIARKSPDDAIEMTRAELPAGTLDTPGTIHAVAAQRLYLQITHPPVAGPVQLRVLAKSPAQATAPAAICKFDISPRFKAGDWILAEVPWVSTDVMRWEVVLEATKPSPGLGYRLLTDRMPMLALYRASPTGAAVYSCTRAGFTDPRVLREDRSGFFRTAYALTLRTGLGAQGVRHTARREAVEGFISAVDNWRLACVACTPYQFAVLDIDGEVWVPQSLLHGEPDNFRASFMGQYPWSLRVGVSRNTGMMTSSDQWVRLDLTPRQRQRFCIQAREAGSGFSAADSPLCRPTPLNSDDEILVEIAWRHDGLVCDPSPAAVACWNGSDLIELNARDYAFYAGDIGWPLVGSAPRRVDLIRVFAHEVGHFMGLGHTVSPGGIMVARFGEARCLDDPALQAINRIALGQVSAATGRELLVYD